VSLDWCLAVPYAMENSPFWLIFHGQCCNLAIATMSILLSSLTLTFRGLTISILLSSLTLAFRGLTSLPLPHHNICKTCSLTFQVREHVLHKVLFCSNLKTLIYSKIRSILWHWYNAYTIENWKKYVMTVLLKTATTKWTLVVAQTT